MRILKVLYSLLSLFVLPAAPAWAVQVHGSPEGYLVHMMSHLFFSAALVFFLYGLHRNPPSVRRPWRYIKWSLSLFLLWNISTFTTHWLDHNFDIPAMVAGSTLANHYLPAPFTVKKVVYYIGRFDHLLCVPAMWFLLLALRGFCRDIEAAGLGNENGETP